MSPEQPITIRRKIEKLQEVPTNIRDILILELFTYVELGIREPELKEKITKAMDSVEGFSLPREVCFGFLNRANELRGEGNFSSTQSLLEKARQMVDLNSNELEEAFLGFAQEVRETVEGKQE